MMCTLYIPPLCYQPSPMKRTNLIWKSGGQNEPREEDGRRGVRPRRELEGDELVRDVVVLLRIRNRVLGLKRKGMI